MLKRLAVSLALMLAAMVLVFSEWAESDESIPAAAPLGVHRTTGSE
jgi:hypothetical protein